MDDGWMCAVPGCALFVRLARRTPSGASGPTAFWLGSADPVWTRKKRNLLRDICSAFQWLSGCRAACAGGGTVTGARGRMQTARSNRSRRTRRTGECRMTSRLHTPRCGPRRRVYLGACYCSSTRILVSRPTQCSNKPLTGSDGVLVFQTISNGATCGSSRRLFLAYPPLSPPTRAVVSVMAGGYVHPHERWNKNRGARQIPGGRERSEGGRGHVNED
ncbi:hypothetical protein C8Q77DRAFT_583501 [Trametes polyzona]|nr:hypothetical protein C8Q77DRAFT_583501 [Trametes polyzona]